MEEGTRKEKQGQLKKRHVVDLSTVVGLSHCQEIEFPVATGLNSPLKKAKMRELKATLARTRSGKEYRCVLKQYKVRLVVAVADCTISKCL
jgi:hypothetical protein